MINTLSAEAVLCEKGFLSETIVGTSMLPLLKEHRDTVIIEKITEPLRKYDVVLFRRSKQLVLHCIVKGFRSPCFYCFCIISNAF